MKNIYKIRYLVGLLLLIVLTGFGFHGDSMSAYDYYIQPGVGNENLYPLLGQARIVRSDEWVVSTPAKLASSFGDKPFSKYNQIQRATDTLNIVNGVECNIFTVVRNPFILGWKILPRENAFSLNWYAPILIAFFTSLEFFFIIGKQKKGIAAAGAFLTVCSSFYLWWGFPTVIWALEGCVVCGYYFLQKKELWKKILLAYGFVAYFLNFCTPLYPAWQVPFGLIALVMVVWLVHEQWSTIKGQRKSTWMILGVALFAAAGLLGYFLNDIREYIQAISQTVYPGNRVDHGGYYLNKLFYYFQAIDYAYKDLGTYAPGATASEMSAFVSLFPLPIIAAFCYWWKNRSEHWLLGGLLLLLIPFLFYVTTGLPSMVAAVLLLNRTTRIRLVDAIGFIQIVLLMYVAARERLTSGRIRILLTISAVMAPIMALWVCKADFPDYIISKKYMLLVSIVLAVIGFGLCVAERKSIQWIALILCVAVSLRTGVMVRPVMKGMDAIYEKPVAKEIMRITQSDPEAKWMTVDMEFVCSGFLVACGAPTVNSVNTYPNLDMWHALDPTGRYEDVYNRYAHVTVSLTEEDTSMELVAADSMQLHLSYDDMDTMDVSYILTTSELENVPECSFIKLYDEAGCRIYQVSKE